MSLAGMDTGLLYSASSSTGFVSAGENSGATRTPEPDRHRPQNEPTHEITT